MHWELSGDEKEKVKYTKNKNRTNLSVDLRFNMFIRLISDQPYDFLYHFL